MVNDKFVGDAIVRNAPQLRSCLAGLRNLHSSIQNIYSGACDLPWEDYISLSAAVLEFRPELVIELGRGAGTSTALFRFWKVPVVSVCGTEYWMNETVPVLERIMPIGWTDGVNAIVGDINEHNYSTLLGNQQRVMLFWDAHGYQIASTVLGALLPALKGREVFVACHDMRDNRYFEDRDYKDRPLWTRQSETGYPMLHLGTAFSSFEQIIPIVDFCSRNRIGFHSATHSAWTNPEAKSFQLEHSWPYFYWHYFWIDGSAATYPDVTGMRPIV